MAKRTGGNRRHRRGVDCEGRWREARSQSGSGGAHGGSGTAKSNGAAFAARPCEAPIQGNSLHRLQLVLVTLFHAIFFVTYVLTAAPAEALKLHVFFGLLPVLLLGFSADTIKNLFSKRN
jgi:hypothetical protein